MTNIGVEDLFRAFTDALASNDINECDEIINHLQTNQIQVPQPIEWCTYFEAILFEERDQDWAKAVDSYKNLLDQLDWGDFLSGQVGLSLANAYYRQGLWEESVQSAEAALNHFTQLQLPLEQVKAKVRLAGALTDGFLQGAWEKKVLDMAIAHCEQSLEVIATEGVPISDSLQTLRAIALLTLGMAQTGRNRLDEAISHFLESIEILQQIDSRYYALFAYARLADAYFTKGALYKEQVRQASLNALALAREFKDINQEHWILGQLGYFCREREEYDQALAYYEQGSLLVEEIRSGMTDFQARADFMAVVADEYAHAVLTCVATADFVRAFNTIEQARSRAFLDLLDVQFVNRSIPEETMPLKLAEIQKSLPANALLLEYFTTGVIESATGRHIALNEVQRVRFPEPKILLFAVTRDAIQYYPIGISPNLIYPTNESAKPETHFLRPGFLRYLYDHLVGICAEALQNKRRVYICPHGPLHNVPFQALLAEENQTLLHDGGPELVFAPSATILMRHILGKGKRNVEETKNTCLAIGFNGVSHLKSSSSSGAEGMQTPSKPSLHFAEEEALLIAEINQGKALVGNDTKKDSLIALAPTYRYLHFSCHGQFDANNPLDSALHLSPTETLTAAEVLDTLRLNCRLVTLSACESGLNRVKRGDELFGFTRAFLYAGTQAIVATLWRVDERTTHIFAKRFCQTIQEGKEIATALKEAQLYLQTITKADLIHSLQRFAHFSDAGLLVQDGRKGNPPTYQPNAFTPLETILAGGQDNDPILKDHPFFWAPYLLICDPDLT